MLCIASASRCRLSVAKEVAPSPSAAGGRRSEGAACAAVDEGRRRFAAKDIHRVPQTEDGLLFMNKCFLGNFRMHKCIKAALWVVFFWLSLLDSSNLTLRYV